MQALQTIIDYHSQVIAAPAALGDCQARRSTGQDRRQGGLPNECPRTL